MTLAKEGFLSDVWKEGIFNGKVVFCTGGSGSLCSVQVRALVHLGANACIIGRNQEKVKRVAKEIATARVGAKVIPYGAIDVRDGAALNDVVKECVKELGGIDFVIAGAAGNSLVPLMQLSTNAFKAVIDIDLMGSWNVFKSTLPYLLNPAAKHKEMSRIPGSTDTGGRIVFMSAGLQYTGVQLQTHAAVAKAGIDALAVQISIEMGPRGMTSNIIAPGPIRGTEGTDRLLQDKVGHETSIPAGRFGSVKDVADAVVYLFSDAGNYVNGETLVVDGGAWYTHGGEAGRDFPYPDFLLSNKTVTGMKKGDRKANM